jgi:APA family basic amino acid/polyamine antiporter
LAFCGAMAYAELAALRPRAGGEYVYLRDAYGRLAGFLTGWTSFVAGFAAPAAASAMVLALYLDRFVPGAASSEPLFTIPLPLVSISVSVQSLVAVSAVWLFAAVHVRGLGPGRIVTNVLTILKVTALVIFIALGLTIGSGTASNLQPAGVGVAPTSFLLALIPVMFTYSGWNAAAYLAEEIRNPGRNVPRGLLLGTVTVVVIYLLLNVLYLFVMPINELAAVQGSVLDVVADRLLGEAAGDIMGVVSIISLAAGINAWTFAGPRVYYAMARDGVFFPAAARVHPNFKTPAISIVAQTLLATGFILTGSLDRITNYVGFALSLFAGIAVAAVFVLRAREPEAPRPFKALGYPFTPAIFVIVSMAIVVNAFYREPALSFTGVLVILAGIPIYLWYVRRR